MSDSKPSSSFMEELVSKMSKPKVVSSTYRRFKRLDDTTPPDQLIDILGIQQNDLSEVAKQTLELHENIEDKGIDSKQDYIDYKWKLSAFIQLQDIFDAPLYKTGEILNIFHLWYFYYESKYILIEAVLCGLNGFITSANALLRLFLEFSLLQNYYHRVAFKEQSYLKLEKYLTTGYHPSWTSVINNALPKDKFSKTIKFRLNQHLKALSESCVHPYHPDYSPKQGGEFSPSPSFESVFFWQLQRIILDATLWAYYVNFPMLFHPVDTLKKFGFNIPVGLFIDEQVAFILKKSMVLKDYEAFFAYSKNTDDVNSLIDWYNSRRDMSDQEIMSTWNKKDDGTIKNKFEGYYKQLAKMRALREAMSLKKVSNIVDDHTFDIFGYNNWQRIQKNVGKKKQ